MHVRLATFAAGVSALAATGLAITGLAPAAAARAAAAALPRYAYTDLGVLGGLDSQAWTLNGSGLVVGHADTSPGSKSHGFHAFLWTPATPNGTSGAMADLGTLPGDVNSTANGINAASLVVGESDAQDFATSRAYVFDGAMHALGDFGGSFSAANGINSLGEITGYSQLPSGLEHAFLWVPTKPDGVRGKMYDLGTLPGHASSVGHAIGPAGVVVGDSLDADFISQAMIWTPATPNGHVGTMRALPMPAGTQASGALAVNAAGLVVGQLVTASGENEAFLSDGTTTHVLGTLPGGTFSVAYSINSADVAVGYSQTAVRANDHAVAFTGGRVIDLNSYLPGPVKASGVVLTTAFGVNDVGQIVGVATVNGHMHAYLLTPTS